MQTSSAVARLARIGSFLVLALMVLVASPMSILAQEGTPTSASSSESDADGTRKDPVPRGEWAEIGDFQVEIVGFKRNATEDILSENIYNEPPAEGEQFALVSIRVKYIGEETGTPFELDVKAVGKSNVAYDYNNDCGVIPNDAFSVSDLFTDGEVIVNWCWAIKSDDASSLLIYISALLDFDSDPVFFDPVKRD